MPLASNNHLPANIQMLNEKYVLSIASLDKKRILSLISATWLLAESKSVD